MCLAEVGGGMAAPRYISAYLSVSQVCKGIQQHVNFPSQSMAEWQTEDVQIPCRRAASDHSAMKRGTQRNNMAAISMHRTSETRKFVPPKKIQEAAQKSRRQKGYMKIDQYRGSTDIGRRPKIFSRYDDLSSGILYCSQNIFRFKNSGLPQQKGDTKEAWDR